MNTEKYKKPTVLTTHKRPKNKLVGGSLYKNIPTTRTADKRTSCLLPKSTIYGLTQDETARMSII
jgi:hypothetical protein